MATRTFEAGTIVRVPFPYTDRATRQRRPALVVSGGPVGREGALLWVVMITSAENASWPDDIAITDVARVTGLPIPSIVRSAKIAAIDVHEAEPIGQMSAASYAALAAIVRSRIG